DRERRGPARAPAQVSPDRAVLPRPGPDLPRVLHLLLPLGSVRRPRGPQVRRPRGRPAGRGPAPAPRGHRRAVHRRRPAGAGGDPLVMRSSILRRYVEPLLRADLPNLAHIRFGTKSLAYWPARFLTDPDAEDTLRLFEEVVASGRHLAVMAHYSHPRELSTPASVAALQRVRETGAVVRCQAPLIRHVNDDAEVWADMWRLQVRHGAVPYYMFVERDTGPKEYFKVPLARALQIYEGAYRQLSGLCRT